MDTALTLKLTLPRALALVLTLTLTLTRTPTLALTLIEHPPLIHQMTINRTTNAKAYTKQSCKIKARWTQAQGQG